MLSAHLVVLLKAFIVMGVPVLVINVTSVNLVTILGNWNSPIPI
ncbi:protein of unknown function [Xenorhabdus doucetiae]|uniref:Uncharacterized protein n=1 Tax=Xenorhabdus doucetiae TaxID=351671 RepID=A0A068QN07_9GAMM|nr:protein of unknown function [Xenorhabdus doucetiae]